MQDENNVLRLPIILKMNNGDNYTGDLLVSIGGQIERTLNSEARFVSFEDEQGRRFIAKDAISEAIPQARQRRAA